MADAGQFAQDADILLRVGTKANATVKGAGWFDTIIVDVEAVINCFTRYDWSTVDAASAFNSTIRGILIDTGACLAAIEGITWDMSGWDTPIEAEDAITVLRDIANRNLIILKDKKVQTFMIAA